MYFSLLEKGVWFLNAYFDKLGGPKLGEQVWAFSNKMSDIDLKKGKEVYIIIWIKIGFFY